MSLNKDKKFCAMVLAYNEEELIRGCLLGLTTVHTYVVISKPWLGEHKQFDKTGEIAEKMGVEVIYKDFNTEAEEREYVMSLARADGYQYIFIVDVDEFYITEDIEKAKKFIKENTAKRYNVHSCIYFWKNENWETLPRYERLIPICYSTDLKFGRNRNIQTKDVKILPEGITLYHFSFAGSDKRILSKLEHFSHANEMDKNWFENVWKKWTPEMEDIHPGRNKKQAFKRAIPYDCPDDIKLRFCGKI